MSQRIVFIDSHIDNYQSLIAQLPEGAQAVLLDAHQDGIEQILAALQGKTNLDTIDIISHGSPGTITLGSGILNNANLDDYHEPLGQIGQHLAADGDILLYGCEVAKGEAGQAFIERLSQLTYANVAASTNLTGAEGLGGDWLLEAHWGVIQTWAMQFAYDDVLAIIDGTSADNTLTGTAEDDTFTGGAGNDTLIGAGGNDIAVFSGDRAGYEVSADTTGQILVKDIDPADGDDGTDTLADFSTLRFADGSFHADVLAGGEFRVNTTTANSQSEPSITTLSDGGFVVSWTSFDQDGSGTGIYALRYDASGTAVGDEFRVNTYTENFQSSPSITALLDGGFVVSWQSAGQDIDGYGIYAQRYDASGAAAGSEFLVNTYYRTSDQLSPSITALSDGGFVVSWQSFGQDSDSFGIYAKRYDANGFPADNEFPVNVTTAKNQFNPGITALSDGGFVISWESFPGQDGDNAGIFAERYDASGVPTTGDFQINTTTAGAQSSPSITALSGGGFVVSWMSIDQDGSGFGIYAQRYEASGAAAGSEFRVNTYTTGNQSNSSITALSDGGFVVSWMSDSQDGSGYGIYAQRYDANGAAASNEFRVNTTMAGDQFSPSITALSDGGFVVSWMSDSQDGSGYGIYAQRYDANGTPVQDGVKLTAINDAPGFTKGADETAGENAGARTVTVWASDISAGPADESSQTLTFLTSNDNDTLFSAQPAIDASGNLTYTPAANASGLATVTVSLKDDGGTANGGIDTSAAQTFTITINDAPLLNGALTNQVVKFDSNLSYDAGASFSDPNDDALNFSATLANGDPLPAWLQISADGVISGLPAANDSGSYSLAITATDPFGVTISAPMNVTVMAFDVGQLLVSTSGNDILTGTSGIDTATYAFSPSAVTVSLANRAAQNTGHGIDTLSGIENLIGSAANDTLTGDGLANVLDGGLGADRLIGGAGNDTYVIDDIADVIIELGDDLDSQASNGKADQVLTWITLPGLADYVENLTLLGSANVNANGNALANTLTGNAGDNVLDGKSGKDAMLGGAGNDTYVVDSNGDTVIEKANEGIDTVQSAISYTLGGNVENLTLLGTAKLNGTGNSLANILTGNSSSNMLEGQEGHDSLNGGAGNDILIGGLGIDQLMGSTGADTFKFMTVADSGLALNCDAILDFSRLDADKIDISGIDAKSATTQNDAFAWKGTAAFTAAGELHYFYDSSNDVTIVEGNVDTNLSADFQMQLAGNIALTATNFSL